MARLRIVNNKPPGVTLRRNSIEATHQKVFFRWLQLAFPKARSLTFAVPNGGRRDAAEGAHLKAQGVTAGVPDIFMAVPHVNYHGLFIEFKAGKNKPTALQAAFINRLRDAEYKVDVCYSYEEARTIVIEYLKGTEFN